MENDSKGKQLHLMFELPLVWYFKHGDTLYFYLFCYEINDKRIVMRFVIWRITFRQ